MKTDLSAEIVRSLFTYDPATGELRRLNGSLAGWKKGPNGRQMVCIQGHKYHLHRICWLHYYGSWPKQQIDHINNVKDDNRVANLRDVSNRMNSQNIIYPRKHKTSGMPLGVVLRNGITRPLYTAQIRNMGKRIHLGTFPTPEAAYEAYVAAKRQLHEGCTL